MLFDNNRPLPIPDNPSPMLDFVWRSRMIKRRENGLHVQCKHPDTGEITEYSFHDLETRDDFIKRLTSAYPEITYAISGAKA